MPTVTPEGPKPLTDIATLTGRQDLAIQALLNQRPHLTHQTLVRPQGEVKCQGFGEEPVYLDDKDAECVHLE